MSSHLSRWVLAPAEPSQAESLSQKLGVLPAVAQVLINRGLTGEEESRRFLHPSIDQLLPPEEMKGMKEAVLRICEALDRGEKIVIHGDYDADGITATAMLVETLQKLGGEVDFFLPSRFQEGYGLHREALQLIREEGASLVITVDCGITALEESLFARKIGLDLIVTDHHLPQDLLPEAVAVLNPHRVDCCYPFKPLSGAGVAFKLASALLEHVENEFPGFLLDLAALGTVADMVPLLGENRVLASLGLTEINRLRRIGLKALAEAGGLHGRQIDSVSLSFGLTPSLNAAGRMGEADPAVHLLLEQNLERAGELAQYLYRQNQLRRDIEAKIFLEAEAMVLENPAAAGENVITLAREGWHPGVIGIVASRLVERFYRPAIIVAVEEGVGCGSARSIPGFDITAALAGCAGLLERFGGHQQAAGLTIAPQRVAELREQVNRLAACRLQPEDLVPRYYIDAELPGHQVNLELAGQLSALEPFGTANPAPVFCSRSWELRSWRLVGSGKDHLKLNFKKGDRSIKPILFSGASLTPKLCRYRKLDLAFNLQAGTFQDQPVLNVELKDLCYSDSSVSGKVEVVDRRGEPERLDYIRELDRSSDQVAVFTSTRRREEMLKPRLPREVMFITSGKVYRELNLDKMYSQLVLYDLPLHPQLLSRYFKEHSSLSKIRIHLLYSSGSRKINDRLVAMSLPTRRALQEICRVLVETAAGDEQLVFPGPWKDRLTFSSGDKYWERCRDILIETGVLVGVPGGQLKLTSCPESWPEKLEMSSTFRSVQELVDECRKFQELLLQGSKQELARYFKACLYNYSECS